MDNSGIARAFNPAQLAQSVRDLRRQIEQLSSARTGVNTIAEAAGTVALESSIQYTDEAIPAAMDLIIPEVLMEAETAALVAVNEATAEALVTAAADLEAARAVLAAADTELGTRLDTATSGLTTLAADMTTLEGTTLPALDAELVAAEGRLDAAEADLAAAFGAIASPDNLAIDGDLELGITEQTYVVSGTAKSGTKHLRYFTSGYRITYFPWVDIRPGQHLEVKAWARKFGDAGTQDLSGAVQIEMADGTSVTHFLNLALIGNLTETWQEFTARFPGPIPANAVRMRPRPFVAATTGSTGYIDVDAFRYYDVSLQISVSAAQARAEAVKTEAIQAAALDAAAKDVIIKQEALESAASTAQAKVDTAKTALETIIGTKGEIITQISAPTGAKAVEQNLWIRLPDNKPHRWNPASGLVNKWEAVTDKALTDAVAELVQVRSLAQNALDIAGPAKTTADAALVSANGKTKVYRDVAVPSGTGETVGDIWWQFADNTYKVVIGEWTWTGSAWSKQQYGHQSIASVDLGSLTVVGTSTLSNVVAQKVAAASGQFIEADIGKLTVSGTTNLQDAVAQRIAANTGSFISLAVSQLTAGTATMAVGVIDKMYSEIVMSRKIMADQVVLGSFSNRIPDPMFLDAQMTARRNTTAGGVTVTISSGGDLQLSVPGTGSYYIRPTGVTQTAAAYKDWIPVQPGEVYSFTVTMSTVRGASNDLRFTGRTKDGLATTGGFTPASTTFPAGSGTYTHTAKIPANCFWLLPEIRLSGTAGIAYIIKGSMVLKQLIDNNLVVAGGILAENITASEALTAKVAQFLKVTAQQVDTENLWADTAWISKANARTLELLTNDDGSGYTSTVSGQGLKVSHTVKNAAGETVEVQDVIKVGTFDQNFIGVSNGNKVVASIDSNGVIAGRRIEASDELRYRGVELGATLDRAGAGVYNWGYLDYGAFEGASQIRIGPAYYMGVASVDYITPGNRMTKILFKTPKISFAGTGGEMTWAVKMRITAATDTTPITEANSITFDDYIFTNPGNGAWHQQEMIVSRPIGMIDAGKKVQILFMAIIAGGPPYARIFGKGSIVVEDAGQLPPNPSVVKNSGGGRQYIETGTAPVVAPTTSKTTRVAEWGFTDVNSYLGNNAYYAFDEGRGYQGLSPYGGNGNMKSMWLFPDFLPTISGSTIDKVEVFMHFDHWFYGDGGIARIHTHGYTSLPGTWDGTYSHDETGWGVNSGRWFQLGSGWFDGILSGATRGISLAGDDTFRTYGIASNCRIRITYTK